jgi:methylated-DNA-[protein]-cysteine S-methyltransferase
MEQKYTAHYSSPIGLIELTASSDALKSLNFVEPEAASPPDAVLPPVLQAALAQLAEYFAGTRREFDLPLAPDGTDFQRRVWQQLRAVTYGQTASYLEIALAVGNGKAVRAVGAANGSNPISIIIPCHRVIGTNGKLTGYGGGLWRKEWLLQHEGWQPHPQLTLF